MRGLAWTLAALLAVAPAVAVPQNDLSMGQVRSPVLTLDTDRLLAETQFGQRITEDIRLRTEAFAAENEALRIQLTEEERSLTERRPTMEVEEFREAADSFDQRVQQIRAEQDAKERALESAIAQGQRDFLTAVRPVLAGLMVESGAAVILERRDVFLSAALVDITDEAVRAIDDELGDGRSLSAPEEPGGADPAPDSPEPSADDPAGEAPPEAPAGAETEPSGSGPSGSQGEAPGGG